MTKFSRLFGIKESQVKNTCVLTPFLRKDFLKLFGVGPMSKGAIYNTGNAGYFTLVRTGLGPAFLGDAVLHLGDTPCQNIILFGSCGLADEAEDMGIGNLVAPSKCYSLESFTQILSKKDKYWNVFTPDKNLYESFLKANRPHNIKKVINATVGSLRLEPEIMHRLRDKGIQTVDMECSAFFAAAKYTKRKAIAFLYVTDIVGKKPFYENLSPKDESTLLTSTKKAIEILCRFIKKNLIS